MRQFSGGNPGFRRKVTCLTKANVMRQSCGLFRKIVEEEVKRPRALPMSITIQMMRPGG
jgi:isocitrate/isopropylmalate dehydrogenase